MLFSPQILSGTRAASASGGSFDSATTAWVNAVVAAGGAVSPTQKSRVDALIVGLKSDGLFSSNSRLWITAGESDRKQATIDIMNLTVATEHATPTIGAGGYTGNGSTMYVDLNTKPSDYSQFSASYGAYDRTNSTSTGSDVIIGAFDGTVLSDFIPMLGATTFNARINGLGGDSTSGTNSNRQGMYVITTTADTVQAIYKNGNTTPIGTNSKSDQSVATLPNFFGLARDDSGTASSFTSDQIAAWWIGPGLTSTQASNLSSRINTYMTAWGVNVY